MEELDVKGLVVRVVDTGDYDRLLTILTEEEGRILVTGKAVKRLKSPHMPATQPFCYSHFILRKTHKYFYIADSDVIECFFGLRTDLDKLALSAYICDVAAELSVEGSADPDLLRLTLNTLYAIANKPTPLWQIKAGYEFRAASYEGYKPDLVACDSCKCYSAPKMYLDVMNGRLLCANCRHTAEKIAEGENDGTARIYMPLDPSALEALRYVLYAPLSRYLSFSLKEESVKLFQNAAEKYLLHHIERGFESLDFYKSIII